MSETFRLPLLRPSSSVATSSDAVTVLRIMFDAKFRENDPGGTDDFRMGKRARTRRPNAEFATDLCRTSSQHDDPVGKLRRLLNVMCDQHHRSRQFVQ